uniref:UPF0056 membrane protein n=1 Tax=Steinernema glaseri TaxID=37863 RepID=A0A1I7ZCT7_9BILA
MMFLCVTGTQRSVVYIKLISADTEYRRTQGKYGFLSVYLFAIRLKGDLLLGSKQILPESSLSIMKSSIVLLVALFGFSNAFFFPQMGGGGGCGCA